MSINNGWTEGLDAASLFDLLKYVGEYGAIANLIQLQNGQYPRPSGDPDDVGERRKHSALVGMAMIYSGEWEASEIQPLKEEPAFTEEFRYLLASDIRTIWAKDLTESCYLSLVLDIGEFCARSIPLENNPRAIPRFSHYPSLESHLRSALINIVRIFESCLNRE
jgi:hypothetical protein